jgi:hypothetical protein
VEDENTTRCFVKFLMGAEGEEQQIGDECECLAADHSNMQSYSSMIQQPYFSKAAVSRIFKGISEFCACWQAASLAQLHIHTQE